MFVEIIQFSDFSIIIKANNEHLISIKATSLKSLKEKPNKITKEAKKELLNYFNNKNYDFSKLKINLSECTEFTQKVLNELKNIPFQSLVTYKDLGKKINSKAYRAIGTALSKNPYLIILPCHRVIRSDESLGRFTCDVDGMKKFLINHEKKSKIIKKD